MILLVILLVNEEVIVPGHTANVPRNEKFLRCFPSVYASVNPCFFAMPLIWVALRTSLSSVVL